MDALNPEERRSLTRNSGDTIKSVRLRLEEGEIVARAQNISVAGISLLIRKRLEPGTWLVLEPAEPSRCLSPELRAEVIYSRKGDKEDYLVGCRFSRFLTMEDVKALG
jgi:hypothetical protein